ncbi:protein TPX2 isoform X2 [Cryptomeria japonica]|uniref:protein TPX2 isoform X2 n=1 Tax=Cryptomeria japonica TaxID=3369 RepID=UPI0027D9E7C9|nr:protein TPX2 isoform X2 [Cryptomeria japonica]
MSNNNMNLNYIDEKYEFCAPMYFDFSRGETPEEAAEAERWLQTPKAYLPSPLVLKSQSLLESKESSSDSSIYNAVQKLTARISFEHGEPKISCSGSNDTPTGNDALGDINLDSESREAFGTTKGPSDSSKLSKASNNASAQEDAKTSESREAFGMTNIGPSVSSKILKASNNASAQEDAKTSDELGEATATVVKNASDTLKVPEVSDYQSVSSELETESYVTACLFSSGKKQLNLSSVLAHDSSNRKIDESAFTSQEEHGLASMPKIGSEASLSSSFEVGRLIGHSDAAQIAKDTTINASTVCENKQKDSHNVYEDSKKSVASFEIQVAVGNPNTNRDCQEVEKHEANVRRHAQKKILKRSLVRSQRPKSKIPGASQIHTENQYANKRQKLEGGQAKQVCNLREYIPTAKAIPTLTIPQKFHFCTEERFQTHRGTHCQAFAQSGNPASPYVPLAERVFKFQFNDPNRLLTRIENQPLKLTRPKEPDLVTSQRARPTRVKSSAELEEEMLANIPKFKARPLNKKILEAPTLPPLPRSTPQLPEFQEFNLRTEERAHLHPNTLAKLASGPEIKFVSASNKCGSMLNSRFSTSYGHYIPTSIKHRTIERIEEEKGPRKRFKICESYSDTKSMPYFGLEEVSHLRKSEQENSSLLQSSGMNVLPSATTEINGKQLPHEVVEDVLDSMGSRNDQHVVLKENIPHPSQIVPDSTHELKTLSKATIKSELMSLISRENAHISEKKRKPLSEISTPQPTQFGSKRNNCEPAPFTLKGNAFCDQSPPVSAQNFSFSRYPKESLQIKDAAKQDSQTSLPVPQYMR